MVQFASYLRHVLCKTRLISPRINGPIVPVYRWGTETPLLKNWTISLLLSATYRNASF